jgi:hypothetical protein
LRIRGLGQKIARGFIVLFHARIVTGAAAGGKKILETAWGGWEKCARTSWHVTCGPSTLRGPQGSNSASKNIGKKNNGTPTKRLARRPHAPAPPFSLLMPSETHHPRDGNAARPRAVSGAPCRVRETPED